MFQGQHSIFLHVAYQSVTELLCLHLDAGEQQRPPMQHFAARVNGLPCAHVSDLMKATQSALFICATSENLRFVYHPIPVHPS